MARAAIGLRQAIETRSSRRGIPQAHIAHMLRGSVSAGDGQDVFVMTDPKETCIHGRPTTTSLGVVAALCREHHGYASAGSVAVYSFAVFENGVAVAGFAWQPPPPGCAKAVCPEAPHGVLALSRMVAVPRDARALKHISRPLRHQMRHLIDRGRWPVLVTFNDVGQGHTGHVYKCSGWKRGEERKADTRTADDGSRVSRYSNGKTHPERGTRGQTTLVRWEHWACDRGHAAEYIAAHGWSRVPTGRRWTSGNPAFTLVQRGDGGSNPSGGTED